MPQKDIHQAILDIKSKADQLQKTIPAKAASSSFAIALREISQKAVEAADLIKAAKEKEAESPAPDGKQRRAKRKSRRKVYRALAKMLIDLQAGRSDMAQGYFSRKLSVAKFAAHHEILSALKIGNVKPALDYCSEKMKLIEESLKDGSATLGTSVTAVHFLTQELQRHEKCIVGWEVALAALDAGNPKPVKDYIQNKIRESKCQVEAWGKKIQEATSPGDGE